MGSMRIREERTRSKKAVWTLRAEIPGEGGKRKWIQRTVRGSEKEAREELTKLEREAAVLEIGSSKESSAERSKGVEHFTLDELFSIWVTSPKANGMPKAESTQYQERMRYEKHIKPFFGTHQIDEMTKGDFQKLYRTLQAGIPAKTKGPLRASDPMKYDKEPLSPASVRKVYELCRSMFRTAEEQDLISENFATKARVGKPLSKAPAAPSKRDVHTLRDHLAQTDRELYVALRLVEFSGMRRSEFLALRYGDLDDSHQGALDIQRGLVRIPNKGPITTPTKTGSSVGRIELSSSVMEALLSLFDLRKGPVEELRRFDYGFIFSPDELGDRPYHPDVFTERLRRAQRNLGLRKPILWKDLRAYAATELARTGVGLHVAQAMLGHKSILTTMKFYASVRQSDLLSYATNFSERLDSIDDEPTGPRWFETEGYREQMEADQKNIASLPARKRPAKKTPQAAEAKATR